MKDLAAGSCCRMDISYKSGEESWIQTVLPKASMGFALLGLTLWGLLKLEASMDLICMHSQR